MAMKPIGNKIGDDQGADTDLPALTPPSRRRTSATAVREVGEAA